MKSEEELQESVSEASNLVPRGLYKHYKGGIYLVLGYAILETDLQVLIHYRSWKGSTHFVRPLREFVEVVGGLPRYQKIET